MTELRYINWNRFLKSLIGKEGREAIFKGRSFQWACSIGLRDQNIMAVSLDKVDPLVLEYKGCKFHAKMPDYYHIFTVYNDYPFDKIRPNDIVLDIGANIGAFSIPASLRCLRVYAVEPVTRHLLEYNKSLNVRGNLVVIDKALDYIYKANKTNMYEFSGQRGRSEAWTLSRFKELCGRVDYLKLDCEGAEWAIHPGEFSGIRVITGECHVWTSEQRENNEWDKWVKWFYDNGYSVQKKQSCKGEWKFTAERIDEWQT